jgi:hypothetical protein
MVWIDYLNFKMKNRSIVRGRSVLCIAPQPNNLVACTFSAGETINLRDLNRQIHAGLEMLPSQFNISISAQINTVPAGLVGFFVTYLGLLLMKFGELLK